MRFQCLRLYICMCLSNITTSFYVLEEESLCKVLPPLFIYWEAYMHELACLPCYFYTVHDVVYVTSEINPCAHVYVHSCVYMCTQ